MHLNVPHNCYIYEIDKCVLPLRVTNNISPLPEAQLKNIHFTSNSYEQFTSVKNFIAWLGFIS